MAGCYTPAILMKLLSVCSARPNFVKLAALHHAIAAEQKRGVKIEHIIVHTGQHYDPLLSDVFFTQLKIPEPDFNLGVKGGASREEVITLTLQAMLPVLKEEKPDLVIVYGDVNGALGAARAAKKVGIKIAHIEAGLRSGDLDMPEEHNRIEIDQLSDLLFVTEQSGMNHLQKEGCTGEAHLVGNTMIDTLVRNRDIITQAGIVVSKRITKTSGRAFAIATVHRPSNVDDPKVFSRVLGFLQEVSQACPVILPAHPRLKNMLEKTGGLKNPERTALLIIEPLDYISFLGFLQHAAFILTDSGGIQEEAVFLQKRCFTLRRNTERPSTIESGSNVLIDPSKPEDRAQVLAFAKNAQKLDVHVPELWDGHAGERIAGIITSSC